ncbi:TDT family transporter [Gemella sp. GH3]|uniref:TDT family transporter n=1 Tax=unclassified Gemella TaxID=2624949 RepID=UPI0015D0C29D|nr:MULTISPECIES: TDT family transporter [unclassified Gemella]MBF0713308.1 TDT family transporter [Gemella sp. GH3.1]NYS50260.1 TDT family transporter [Gemella sp. GH3]
MKLIKDLPVPIAGLALGTVALGNLLQIHSSKIQLLCNFLSLAIVILLLLKFIIYSSSIKEIISKPILITVVATFPMSIVLLSSYFEKYIGIYSFIFWILAFLLQLIIICIVFVKYVIKERKIGNIYPTWYIAFVGPAVVTVTAKTYNLEWLGEIVFYFTLVNYLILIPIVLYRVFIYKNLMSGEYPTITILAAPGGLLLTSYMVGIANKNYYLTIFLVIIAIVFYTFILMNLPKLLNREFFPSFSAFTFPLIICATSFQKVANYQQIINSSLFNILVIVSEIVAIFIVIFVYYKYIIHFTRK